MASSGTEGPGTHCGCRMSCSAPILRGLPWLSWGFAVEHCSRAFCGTLLPLLAWVSPCLSSGAQETSLVAWGAPISQGTTWDPQHGGSLPHLWAILISRWPKHQLQLGDQWSWLGVAAGEEEEGGWARAAWLQQVWMPIIYGHAHHLTFLSQAEICKVPAAFHPFIFNSSSCPAPEITSE